MSLSPLEQRLETLKTEPIDQQDARAGALAAKRKAQAWYIDQDKAGLDQEALGRSWSALADDMLDQGLAQAWRAKGMERRTKKLAPEGTVPGGTVPGLFILGLGKLGGEDLNFSSDVDLVAFYEPALVPVLPFEGKTDVCSRVLRNLNALLDGHKMGDFAWRIDWRLRPDPSVTDLAMSTDAGLDYFFFHSPPWRRLAMMKARVVAGDKDAGERFLKELHPFIWKRSLDFRSIDEIAMLKAKIRAEHPELASERSDEVPLDQAAGFHLKLGRGGIREIEFLVNALQLVWGGRQAELQTAHTLTALRVFVAEGKLPDFLELAYKLFRALENRVQIWSDGHEHKLPVTEEQQSWIAERSGYGSWEALADHVVATRLQVAQEFDTLFAEHDAEAYEDEALQQGGTAGNQALYTAWTKGFESLGMSLPPKPAIIDLARHMVRVCEEASEPEKTAQGIQAFLRSLGPSAPTYLRLFSERPHLVRHIIEPLARSDAMTVLLHQSPYVVDGLMSMGVEVADAPDIALGRELVGAAPYYERKLGALRAFVNEQLYLAYLAVFDKRRDTAWAQAYLSALAEQTLAIGAEVLCEELGLEALPFSVIGMGKLATRAMMPLSDLDLIFIVPDGADFDASNKVARRFIAMLDAPMKEGRAYPTDTRLRPSGRSGPPTVSMSSFARYHRQEAHTWEHLALVTARPVLDATNIAEPFAQLRAEILGTPRDGQQLVEDSTKMLERLRTARYQSDIPDHEVKLRPGGLMELEFLANMMALQQAPLQAELANPLESRLYEALDWPFADKLKQFQAAQFFSRLHGPNWPSWSGFQWSTGDCDQVEAAVQAQIYEAANWSLAKASQHADQAIRWL